MANHNLRVIFLCAVNKLSHFLLINRKRLFKKHIISAIEKRNCSSICCSSIVPLIIVSASLPFLRAPAHFQSTYLLKTNYNYVRKHQQGIDRLVYELQKLTLTTQHSYIAYQRNTYHNVPLWVLVNALTFGTLSKMYFFFPLGLQSKVSKNFAHVNEKQLGQFLTVMTKFRNVCAHNERLFSYRSKDAIPDMALHSKLGIPKERSLYQCGKMTCSLL